MVVPPHVHTKNFDAMSFFCLQPAVTIRKAKLQLTWLPQHPCFSLSMPKACTCIANCILYSGKTYYEGVVFAVIRRGIVI